MEPSGWDRILVTTDMSPFAEKAVRYAHELAEKLGSELHVLHVARDLSALVASLPFTGVIEPGAQHSEDDYRRWLATFVGASGTVRRVEAVRLSADVPAAIQQYVEKNGISLVVIATHGRTGLTHLLMGSVTEQVLRGAKCPVLVIRP
jgi:nucleotide-binding universal stress UspA family protein